MSSRLGRRVYEEWDGMGKTDLYKNISKQEIVIKSHLKLETASGRPPLRETGPAGL